MMLFERGGSSFNQGVISILSVRARQRALLPRQPSSGATPRRAGRRCTRLAPTGSIVQGKDRHERSIPSMHSARDGLRGDATLGRRPKHGDHFRIHMKNGRHQMYFWLGSVLCTSTMSSRPALWRPHYLIYTTWVVSRKLGSNICCAAGRLHHASEPSTWCPLSSAR